MGGGGEGGGEDGIGKKREGFVDIGNSVSGSQWTVFSVAWGERGGDVWRDLWGYGARGGVVLLGTFCMIPYSQCVAWEYQRITWCSYMMCICVVGDGVECQLHMW